MSYPGRVQDALHDVLQTVIPDGTVVDWKIRSDVIEAVNLHALPIFEREVEARGARKAADRLAKLILEPPP